MARKSRRNIENTTIKDTSAGKVYHAALYARISSEDERKRECGSMENQVKMLRDYVSSCEDIAEYELYMDRAVTGTKFDRPEFNRMVADMRAGKFNCIVVKDLSRFGRNYLETGNYLESIFPIFGIRFISITDHYDSLTAKATEDGLTVPLKNLINEAYAKDISKKVKTSLDTMKRQGKYVATFVPYGYKRDPKDNHHLIIDEEVAGIVRRIFEEKASGKTIDKITADLNDDDIPSPGRYAYEAGRRKREIYKTSLWGRNTVLRTLKNRCYTGDLVQGKTETALYRGVPKTDLAEEDYIVVENTHEAIISHELFNDVQMLLENSRVEMRARKQTLEPFEKHENLYGDIFVCGDCGARMSLKSYKHGKKRTFSYVCPSSSEFGKKCSYKCISQRKMDRLTETFLRQQISVYMGSTAKAERLNRIDTRIHELNKMKAEIAEMEDKVKKLEAKSRNLYADFVDGLISEDDYLFAKNEYLNEQDALVEHISRMRGKAEHLECGYGGNADMSEAYRKNNGFIELTRDVVRDLIEQIVFYGKGKMEIKLRFESELQDFFHELEEAGARYGE